MSVVIFDVDGTLVDSVEAHASAWQDTLREFGVDAPLDAIKSQIGKGSDQLLKAFLEPADIQRLEKRISKRRVEIYMEDYISGVQVFPGVRELVRRIREDGHQVVLGTSATDKELKHNLRTIDIDDLIQGHTTADDADKSKPHPDIFQAALSKVKGATPKEALVIGDTPYDAEAATRGGMKVVGVTTGGFTEGELREAGCVAIFRDIKDMLARYQEIPF